MQNIGKQIKAYRIKKGLTQEKLARRSYVHYSTLTKIESGAIKNPSINVIANISKALGIQVENFSKFLPSFDLKQSVQIFKGDNSVAKLLDDVYATLKKKGGHVCISGIDERRFLKADKKAIKNHIKRLAKAGITERLLAREGDLFFFAGTQSLYRWVPENLFSPTPIYVYANKIAMIVWSTPIQIVIIKNEDLADAYRKQFLFMWESAKVPPSKNIIQGDKKKLISTILKHYGGRISPITQKDAKLFRDFLAKEKTKTYGNSFYYLCQAANGTGSEKLGLKYFDGEMLAPIGVFNRGSFNSRCHFHIIHPIGKFDYKKIKSVSEAMLNFSGNPVFIKKITKEQQQELLDNGFSPIENYPWHTQALEEDDTFPEQVVDIRATIKRAEGNRKCDTRDKYKRFLSKYEQDLSIKDLTPRNRVEAKKVVRQFFSYLESKKLHISSPTDFDNIIYNPPLGKNGKTYFSQLLYIKEKPAAFFAAEPISKDTAGLYANITFHQKYSYISEYLIVYICQLLKKAGYKYLNLGGSETSGLFQFKDKFSPVGYNKMHWVVYEFN